MNTAISWAHWSAGLRPGVSPKGQPARAGSETGAPSPLSAPLHVDAQDFARLTFDGHFKRTTADFAVGGEALRRDAGVDGQFGALTTKRTLDGFGDLHERLHHGGHRD